MHKFDPIQNLDRISDKVKLITWICQNCDQAVAVVKWINDIPYCAECAKPLEEEA